MVSTDDSKSFSLGSNPSRATPKLIAMIKLNENYAVTPTGAKTLIIEEGDDWNKVCDKVVGCRFDYIFIPQEFENQACYFLPQITVQGKQIGKICTYKVVK